MSDGLSDDIVTVAEEYLDSLEGGGDSEVDPDEAREELEYWEEQVGEFEEGTVMNEMVVGERNEWREKLEAVDALDERREELRVELLTRASTEFAPQGEWLEPAVVEALSYALVGRRQEQLLVDRYRLPTDAEEFSKREMVGVAKTIQALAGDAVGADDGIADLWEALDTETQRSVAGVLVKYQVPLSSGEISDEVGEDGTDSPGSNIRYLRGQVDIQPYYSTNDGYTLSLAGRYVWMEYGPETPEAEPTPEDGGENQAQGIPEDGKTEADRDADEAARTCGEQEETVKVDLSSFEIRE